MFGSGSTRLAPQRLVNSGDVARFEGLYDRTFPTIYRYVFRGCYNAADAEDITSETFERALRNLPRLRGPEADLDRWIFGIARHVLREWWRNRDRRFAPPEAEHEDVMTGGAMPQCPDFSMLFRCLTPIQREVLELRMTGLKVHEVADILGKAEGTIKALQFAALRNLRKAAHVE